MQITKLSFLSTQPLGGNVFAVEEMLDIPIEQVFGTHKSREKAFVNLIESDAVQKVSRDTWKIVKDITLDAANVTMRQGDFFRVRLDEQGDASPIHFDLDATGVFVLNRDVFASLQTYEVLDPGKTQRIRMQFTFGGVPVVDARLTSKFASMKLEPVDATNGIYELVLTTRMAPSDDILPIEVTGNSLRNTVYEAPVHITVREPVLTFVPIDLAINARQTKTLSWKLLMEGAVSLPGLTVRATVDEHISKVSQFTLKDVATATYQADLTAKDETGATVMHTTYDFGYGYTASIDIPLSVLSAPSVFITQDTLVLEANQEQLIRFFVKQGSVPVPNAKYSTTDIRGPGLQSVATELVTIDAATGLYAYRVTTNHKGGPISVRTNILINGTPYPVFFDLTSKSTPVTAVALNTLPAADASYLQFRVQQERLGGLTPLVGVLAKVFTVTGSPVVGVQGAVEAVGQGVYRLKVVTNDRGGPVNVAATLTVEGEDSQVFFSTTAAVLSKATVAYEGASLIGEKVQAVPVSVYFEGKPYDLETPVATLTGNSLVSAGLVRRVGVGKYEVQAVNLNGKGGVLNIRLDGKVYGYAQSMTTSAPVSSVSAVVATNVTHFRPTTQGPLQFTALRDGAVLPLTFSTATLTGGGVASYDGAVETLDASKGRYQVKNVVASGPATQTSIGVSAPYKLRGYSYTLVFNSYTEAMPKLKVDTQDVIVEGGVKGDYLLYISVDDEIANPTASTVSGSGTAFVSMDDSVLHSVGDGIWSVKGLMTTEDRGNVTLSGTLLIDGILYPYSLTIKVKDARPELDNPDIPPGTDPGDIPGSGPGGEPGDNDDLPFIGPITGLEAEKVQTVFFKLSKKGNPIGDATLANGTVSGEPVSAYDGFALHSADTGTYRFNVTTNAVGGYAEIHVDITIDGELYPTTYRTFVQTGKPWAILNPGELIAGTTQGVTFQLGHFSEPIVSPSVRNLTVTGQNVKASANDVESLNSTTFRTNGISLDSTENETTLKLEASSNQLDWHTLEYPWYVEQAAAPVVTAGPMLPANATSIFTFTILRDGKPLLSPTLTGLTITGTPVVSANLDVLAINNRGTYGTTIKTNELGGDITLTFNVVSDGVTYPVTLTAQADIVRPWTASLVNAPVPETATDVDITSVYGGGPVAITDPVATVVGDSVLSPVGEIAMVYQDAARGIYRIPSVLLNNEGGPVTFEIKGKVYDSDVSTVLQTNITPLPEMTLTPVTTELPFQQAADIVFTVQRGTHPTIFTSSDVKNLKVTGAAIQSFTPTVVPVSAGRYKIAVVTGSAGGAVNVSFSVTVAGVSHDFALPLTAAVEPPVTANAINTLETNTTGTNLDFQLTRGSTPCADPFIVQSIAITGRSITSYPQTVINVNVAQGLYRMQVNTSAYSEVSTVTIKATVRGDAVTLTFQVQIKAGVLPMVTLVKDSFVQGLQSSAVIAFKQGTSDISGVTLTSVEGPLDQATLSVTTLSGVPSVAGPHDLTINYAWRGAQYSGVISINPVASVVTVPTGGAKLKAYFNNPVNFAMKQLDGTDFPDNTAFTTETSAFTVATPLAKQPDGTYTIGLSYGGELPNTPFVVTATNGLNVTKFIMTLNVWLTLEARFSGTTLLDSSQVSNLVQFDVYEKNQGNVFQVYANTDLNSLDVHATNPDDLVGFSTFAISSSVRYRGTFFVSTAAVDLADLTYKFYWTSPLNRVYTINGVFRVQKPILATWVDPTLTGGIQSTVQFYLKSGTLPITDAVDATTTITGGTIVKAPYAVNAATGLYAIDVKPNGGATTLNVTLKIKQQVNNLVSVLAVKGFTVTPGAFVATPVGTLTRAMTTQTAGIKFTQGGTAVSAVTVNSVTFDGAIQSMVNPVSAAGGVVNWTVQTNLNGPTPHVILNVTINGEGMVLETDWPIAAAVEPVLYLTQAAPALIKGQAVQVKYLMMVNGSQLNVTQNYGLDDVTSDNLRVQGQSMYSPPAIAALVTPTVSGTAVELHFPVVYLGVTYVCKWVVDVADSVTLKYKTLTDITTGPSNKLDFTLTPPAGVTLDPAAVPTIQVRYSSNALTTNSVVNNGNGNYTVDLTDSAEHLGLTTSGTIVSGGVTYQIGCSQTLNSRYAMTLGRVVNASYTQSETAGSTVRSQAVRPTDVNKGTQPTWTINPPGTTMTNVRVTSDTPNVLNGDVVIANVGQAPVTQFAVATNMVDFATLTWMADFVSPATGFPYPNLSTVSVVHDTAVMTVLPAPTNLIYGQKYDLQFKLNWATSGNPVKNAIFASAHTISNGVVDATLKLVDADQGIYAVTVTMPASGTVTITPKWTYPNSFNTYTGTAFSVTGSTGVTAPQPLFTAAPSSMVNTARDTKLALKLNPLTGFVPGAHITNYAASAFVTAPAGAVDVAAFDDAAGVYRMPMTTKAGTAAPSTGAWVPVDSTVSVTFSKGGVDQTHLVNLKVYNNTVPIIATSDLTTLGGEFFVTPQAGVTGGFTAMGNMPVAGWTIYGSDGEVVSGLTGVSTYATNGKIYLNLPELPKMRKAVIVINTMNNSNNLQINVGGGEFDVPDIYRTTITDGGTMTLGTARTVTFSLTPPAGVTYNSPTVSVASNPWTTAGSLVDNGDGTYSISITPDVETGGRIIKLNVVQDGKTYVHGVKTKAVDPAAVSWKPASVSESLPGGASSVFSLYDKTGNVLTWNLSDNESVLRRSSIELYTDAPGVTVGALTITPRTLRNTLGIGAAGTAPAGSADYAEYEWSAEVVSPVTGALYNVAYDFPAYKAITATWVTTQALISGMEQQVQFTLKYTGSGLPVTNAHYVTPHTVSNATVTNELIAVDAANGLYAVKVTPGTTSFTVTPNYAVGLSTTPKTVFGKTFSVVVGAKPTYPAMAGVTRTMGIVLMDSVGPVGDATITSVSGGAIMDAATGGPWTTVNAATGVYQVPMPASMRTKPTNTNTTPSSSDTVTVTYTRGGVTYTMAMVVEVRWAHVKVAMDPWASSASAVTASVLLLGATPTTVLSGFTFSAPTVYGEAGVTQSTTGGAVTNNTTTTGKLNFNVTSKKAAQKNATLLGTCVNGSGTNYYYWTDPFEITYDAVYVISPTVISRTARIGTYIASQVIADIELLITNDQGTVITNAVLGSVTTQAPANLYAPVLGGAGGTDWSTALVPKTDGSDGKYLLKLYCNGYTGGTAVSSTITLPISSATLPGKVTNLPLNVRLNA